MQLLICRVPNFIEPKFIETIKVPTCTSMFYFITSATSLHLAVCPYVKAGKQLTACSGILPNFCQFLLILIIIWQNNTFLQILENNFCSFRMQVVKYLQEQKMSRRGILGKQAHIFMPKNILPRILHWLTK